MQPGIRIIDLDNLLIKPPYNKFRDKYTETKEGTVTYF